MSASRRRAGRFNRVALRACCLLRCLGGNDLDDLVGGRRGANVFESPLVIGGAIEERALIDPAGYSVDRRFKLSRFEDEGCGAFQEDYGLIWTSVRTAPARDCPMVIAVVLGVRSGFFRTISHIYGLSGHTIFVRVDNAWFPGPTQRRCVI